MTDLTKLKTTTADRIDNLRFIRENGGSKLLDMPVAATAKGELLMRVNEDYAPLQASLRSIGARGYCPITGTKGFVEVQVQCWNARPDTDGVKVDQIRYAQALDRAIAFIEGFKADLDKLTAA